MNKKKNTEELKNLDWVHFISAGALDKNSNPLDLIAFTESGVSAERVYELKKELGWTISEIAYCINSNEKNLGRAKTAQKTLKVEPSQSILEICLFLNSYSGLFLKSEAKSANAWLFMPMKEFKQKRAFDLLNTIIGRRYVLSVFSEKAVDL